MPKIEFEDFEIYYESHGTGEPLVLISGFASGVWNWNWQIEDLSKDFQVLTFDPRGIGKSKTENKIDLENLSMSVFAEDVLRILDELQIERAHVLGASFGGFVAQNFALSFPERLNKLILACTSFGGTHHVAPDLEILMAFASTDEMNTKDKIRKFMIPAFTSEFKENHSETIEEVCRLREESMVPENVYKAQLIAATTFDYEISVREIENETLIITGDEDLVVPVQNSVNLAKKMPNAKLEIIENGSHMFFIEKAEEFNQLVREFLKK